MPPTYQIIPATTPHHHLAARTLFTAYAAWLNIDLTFQNFQAELSSLPGKYSPQEGGDLLLAYSSSADPSSSSSSPLGCVALRPLSSGQQQLCEVKRLYVAPEARKMGLGRALVSAIVTRARELGYRGMRLDTLRSMEGPIRLYRSLGFVEVGPYYETPLVEETVFLGLDFGEV
ncbi:acyl-CoA N-acyltransferase [Aspergillus costaricaensis CBS 115574]|uniref:Acyl-CoA N-acyltransferase n=1 Tax=Aspergillus costaricaensis CBS 115574 TaxID=1448317 RepID=A0ACD1I8F5_9EURO|nr:acyl-CoA N-acyltransferase [Aspergillus costaricaensis CBS 115574]RAK86558.1 acyl-CoA N-acyltransferase [Aspergillus costaricaensis CBS 115574]